jgi:hypothetical protein
MATAHADTAGQRCVRLVAAASALCIPTAQAAVLALHARDGRAHYRHSEGPVPHYIKWIMPTASKPSEWESFSDWSNSSGSWLTTGSM